jgi:hypothetical protein
MTTKMGVKIINVRPGMAAVLYESGFCRMFLNEEVHGLSFKSHEMPRARNVLDLETSECVGATLMYTSKGKYVHINTFSPGNLVDLLQTTKKIAGKPRDDVCLIARKDRELYEERIRKAFGENVKITYS